VVPAVVALLLPVLPWRWVTALMALLGLGVVAVLFWLSPRIVAGASAKSLPKAKGRSGFTLLMMIGALDTATRMGYLLFLPFLVHGRGGGTAMVGLALALLFVGGALGKATCGWLGERLGVVGAVVATETATAVLILATLTTPLGPTLALLPLLGIVLNGTSSVLYGTVPELAPSGDVGQAFAFFYTAVIGAGGLAPILYGALADHTNRNSGLVATAVTAAVIVPLVFALRGPLSMRQCLTFSADPPPIFGPPEARVFRP
jgi:FSR family fosmidomycin resistance protein-like MFS transporter